MLWLNIKEAASCRICAQSRRPGRTRRGQGWALPFPLLTLRGSLEARHVLKRSLQSSQPQSLLQKEAGQVREEPTELNSPRGRGFYSLSSMTADGHVEALVCPLRTSSTLSHFACSTSLHHVPKQSAPLCAPCPAPLRDPRPNPQTASPLGSPLSFPSVPPHCTGGASRQLRR